ncbi:MAG TPA: alpha/beta fold hydrolase [Steroidobacteraceae bacterium]|nr:alpha/beta fold hydrolase [Steroidobacteraceae bacterium]
MSPAPARPQGLGITGPAGNIQAVVEDPRSDGDAYGVVCHPHPLFGGTMDNKVVTTVARALQECAIPTVRFNFRGVGSSEGTYDEGVGETDDVCAVADWGERCWPGRRLMLAGFSFGAYVALRAAQRRELANLILVAPPVGRFDFSALAAPRCPWLVIQGDADDVVDPQAVADWARRSVPTPTLACMHGVGHFFHGRLSDLRDAVIGEVRSA